MKIVYIINEVKGVTEALRTTASVNVVRDYKGDNKSFVAVSLNQPIDAEAIIVVKNHFYQTNAVEVSGGQRRFFAKTSTTISIVTNLYNRGVKNITVINYKGKDKIKTFITPEDNLYNKIDEICGVDNTKRFLTTAQKRLNMEHRVAKHKAPFMNLEKFKYYNIELPTEKELQLFKMFAMVYGLNPEEPADIISFRYYIKHPEHAEDFLEGTSFRCPVCGNVVRVNGSEEYINGRYINTGKTVCDNCYEEFEIHDKQDILEMVAQRG